MRFGTFGRGRRILAQDIHLDFRLQSASSGRLTTLGLLEWSRSFEDGCSEFSVFQFSRGNLPASTGRTAINAKAFSLIANVKPFADFGLLEYLRKCRVVKYMRSFHN